MISRPKSVFSRRSMKFHARATVFGPDTFFFSPNRFFQVRIVFFKFGRVFSSSDGFFQVRIGFELGSDWVRIGFGLGSNWVRIGFELGPRRFFRILRTKTVFFISCNIFLFFSVLLNLVVFFLFWVFFFGSGRFFFP